MYVNNMAQSSAYGIPDNRVGSIVVYLGSVIILWVCRGECVDVLVVHNYVYCKCSIDLQIIDIGGSNNKLYIW